jgi:hypothetical protein
MSIRVLGKKKGAKPVKIMGSLEVIQEIAKKILI